MNTPYLVKKRYGWYWQPSRRLQRLGFTAVALGKDEAKARRDAIRINAEVRQKEQSMLVSPVAKRGTVSELIDAFKRSDEFSDVRPKTQQGYTYCLGVLDSWAGEFQVSDVDAKALKTFYRSMRETTPSKANAVLRVVRLLWKWGLAEGYTKNEPARHVRIKGTEPRHALWTPEEVDALVIAADHIGRPSVGLAIRIAFDCTQRQGDVLSLTWNQIQDGWITFVQSKTGAQCDIPMSRALSSMLSKTKRAGVQVVISEITKQPYDEHAFRKVFSKVRFAANRAWQEENDSEEDRYLDRQFMDLRRSGMVEAAHAGVDLRDIAARSGHQIDRTMAILNTYLPATKKMAATAVAKVDEMREQRLNKRD